MDISQFTEADVREEIITPLLHALAYRSGTRNDIRRELSLRYPRDFLGHKKPKSDPPLRGRADYVCEIDRRLRWTIEAKPPIAQISADDTEQAYTYAKHPEIAAAYYCLCTGYTLRIHATNVVPASPVLLEIDPRKLDEAVLRVRSLLGPDDLRARFAEVAGPAFPPIGPGLLSFAQIAGGEVIFERTEPDVPFMRGLLVTVTGGSIQRAEEGGLIAYLTTVTTFESLQRTNERLGIDRFEATSRDEALSTDPSNPTRITSRQVVTLPKGEPILNLTTWTEEPMPLALTVRVETSASGFLAGNIFAGEFDVVYLYTVAPPLVSAGQISLALRGRFRLVLS